MQFYLNEEDVANEYTLPNCEVFYAEEGELWDNSSDPDEYDGISPEGYYYWFCMPGCLPDSEPYGPYDTEEEAIADCREMYS